MFSMLIVLFVLCAEYSALLKVLDTCALLMCPLLYVYMLLNMLNICDWTNKKGPSGHIKFDHIFKLC